MFEKICLSKSKPRTIVLLHGLFTGPGFWLPYLKYFRDYNVVLIDIDYSLISDLDKFFPEFYEKIQEISETKDLVAIISHSLGTYVSLLLGEQLSKCNVHICPIYISERLHTDQFSELIATKDKMYSPNEVLLMLDEVDAFVRKNAALVSETSYFSTRRFVPDQDAFFTYQTISLDVSLFAGDHFNIDNALLQMNLDGDI